LLEHGIIDYTKHNREVLSVSTTYHSGYAAAIALLSVNCTAAAGPAPETSHLEFVQEYVRELAELEDLRANAQEELVAKKGSELSAIIYSSTRQKMALEADIRRLGNMRLNEPVDFLIPSMITLYRQKCEVYDGFVDVATEFMSGPKPDVDYGKLSAELPKLRAKLDSLDETLFHVTVAVEATLIADKPDSHGHMSRLVITKSERDDLIKRIQTTFGTKLNQKQQSFVVSSATVLRDWLRSGYIGSDEPEAPIKPTAEALKPR
jgi:hypothetical protein